EAVRRAPVGEQRPAELADDEHARLFGDAAPRRSPALLDLREGLGPFHGREPPGKGDDALECRASWFQLAQRPAAFFAVARTRALGAAGFFLVSAPMLARNASMRLMTRCGWASSLRGWMTAPACLARSNSTSADS